MARQREGPADSRGGRVKAKITHSKQMPSSTQPTPTVKRQTEIPTPYRQMGELPTTDQIAMIAATLSKNAGHSDSVEKLTQTAISIWLESRNQVWRLHMDGAIDGQDEKNEEEAWDYENYELSHQADDLPHLPQPQWPFIGEITRDVFFQQALPKSYITRRGRRESIAKQYISYLLQEGEEHKPTNEEIERHYKNWSPFSDHSKATEEFHKVMTWWKLCISSERRKSGQKGANKRARISKEKKAAEKHSQNFTKVLDSSK
jgi:hypothetical protein